MNILSSAPSNLGVIAELINIIDARKGKSPDESYTAFLLNEGVEKCAKKLGEEGVEMALASMGNDTAHFKEEAADLLYHYLVLLTAKNVDFADVIMVLEGRLLKGKAQDELK